MNIITGYRGEAHITADQIRDENQGCFGDGSYILGVGSKLAATAVSATSVQLADGIISHQGCTASIPYGTTEAVTIGNGTQGMQRVDLIVARYTKDAGTGVEDMALAVIQGTPAASDPVTPSYNAGSIHAGDSPVDMPLFKVILDGISIDEIVQVADSVKTQAETDADVNLLSAALDDFAHGSEPSNLNNITETGFYSYSSSASNVPSAAGGTLLHIKTSGTYSYQLAFQNQSTAGSTGAVYYRLKNSFGWHAWQKVATD